MKNNKVVRVFVSGSTGLIGAHLLYSLCKRGHHIRALYRSVDKLDEVKRLFQKYYLANTSLYTQIEWYQGDLLDLSSLKKGLTGIEYVYHCGGMVSFSKSEYKKMRAVNILGTRNMATLSLEMGVKKFCHVSSSSALGKIPTPSETLIDENTPWYLTSELTDYAISKYEAEQKVWKAANQGLKMIIVNPTIILGAGNWQRSSARIFKKVWTGMPFYVPGYNGFIDVRDVCKIMILLTESDIVNERYALVSENFSLQELLNQIADNLGKKRPTIRINKWLGLLGWKINAALCFFNGKTPAIQKSTVLTAQRKYLFSNSKIKQELGIKFIPIKKSIQDNCQYFLKEYGNV